MKKVINIIKTVLFYFLSFTPCVNADVIEGKDILSPGHIYSIQGTITKDDVSEVSKILRKSKKPVDIYLNSLGGDLDAALRIGDILYSASPTPSIYAKTCASACVFILASSKQRIVGPDAKIIVHRPYSSNTSEKYEDIRTMFSQLKGRALHQISRVGVSERLWDLTMSVASQDAKQLSYSELVDLNLSGNDPAFDDHLNNMRARELGISKTELFQRSSEFKKCVEAKIYNTEYYIPKEYNAYPYVVACGKYTGWMPESQVNKLMEMHRKMSK